MSNPFALLLGRYKHLSLQSKLVLSYFLLIFAPIVILSLHSYYRGVEVIQRQTAAVAKQYLQQAEGQLTAELSRMEDAAKVVAQRTDVRRILEKRNKTLPFPELYKDMNTLWEDIESLTAIYRVNRIRLHVSDSFPYSRSNFHTYSLSELATQAWYQDLASAYGSQTLLAPYLFRMPLQQEQPQVSSVVLIRSMENINEIIGVVMVDLLASDLQTILSTADYTHSGVVILLDASGIPLCSSGLVPEGVSVTDWVQRLLADGNHPAMVAEGDLIGCLSAPLQSGWRVFTLSSYHDVLAERNLLRNQQIGLALLVGVVVYALGVFTAWHNTRRIRQLAERMKQVEQGDFNVMCVVDSEDEIGDLQNSFNYMIRKVNLLMQEQYNLGSNLKGLELKALQAQINPHFLYNTLDLISWKAQKSHAPEIMDIVYKLAQFYRISLSHGSDAISLRDEFEHIRLYVELQNLRCEQAVQLTLELAPDVASCLILKLTLQPMVENSLLHGIQNLDGKQGHIRISAQLAGGDLLIEVLDNGVGMERGKLVSIMTRDGAFSTNPTLGGFGLPNIMERLRLHYNNRASLEVTSDVEGTKITLRIPYDLTLQRI